MFRWQRRTNATSIPRGSGRPAWHRHGWSYETAWLPGNAGCPRPKIFHYGLHCRHRLCEHEAVSVQIYYVELHHPVILGAKRTRYLHSRRGGILLVQRVHIVRDDVNVPRMALAPARIIRSRVSRLLLQEYLNLVAP